MPGIDDLPNGELREAKRACNLLRLAVHDAEALLRQARQRLQTAEERFDALMLKYNGQMELPWEDE